MTQTLEVVLSPAALRPSPRVPFTALDPDQRLELYRSAFSDWLDIVILSGKKLCIVETTGESARTLLGDREGEADFLSHEPDTSLEPLGKGALESSALDAGMSFIAEQYGEQTTVHKVTGKLLVPNWRSVLKPIAVEEIRIRRSMDRGTCDTRVFTTSPATWLTYFGDAFTETNDVEGRYLEHVVGQRSIAAEYNSQTFRVSRFSAPPKIRGISGSDGKAYGGFNKDGLSNVLARIEKHILPPFQRRMI